MIGRTGPIDRVRTPAVALFLPLAVTLALALVGCSSDGTDSTEGAERTEGTDRTGDDADDGSPDDDRTGQETPGARSERMDHVDGSSLAGGGDGEPGRLVDATEQAGLDQALLGIRGHATAAADVDDDGWTDLFVGTFADREPDTYRVRGADGPAPDRLLLGSANGFTIDPGFEGRLGRTAGAVFADLDGDGDPDLVVSRNVRDSDRGRAPSEIYRNDDGQLVPALVLDDERGGRAVGIVDFDTDGRPDIVLVEDRWSGASTGLFRNDGGLAFSDVTAELGFPGDVSGLGVGIGDLNGDGIDDLVVGGSNRWFLGDGSGFVEGATSPLPWERHGDEDDPAHVLIVDVDDDDLPDILMGQHFNSTIDAGIAEPVRLFRNLGSDPSGQPRFEDETGPAGLPSFETKSPQIVLADLTGDGRRDLVTTASIGDEATGRQPIVVPALAPGAGGSGGGPLFGPTNSDGAGPHYWIDAVTLDANGDGRTDVFFVEWEPAIGSRLFLNLPDG